MTIQLLCLPSSLIQSILFTSHTNLLRLSKHQLIFLSFVSSPLPVIHPIFRIIQLSLTQLSEVVLVLHHQDRPLTTLAKPQIAQKMIYVQSNYTIQIDCVPKTNCVLGIKALHPQSLG